MQSVEQPAILTAVEVDSLFGYLNYRIDFEGRNNLSLLYGENGSGKTTLLWLIYAALSPSRTEGLKNYIITVPFKRFKLATSIGCTIEITRPEPTDGPYRFTIDVLDRFRSVDVRLNSSRKLILDENPEMADVLSLLSDLKIDLHFLSDDRQMRSTSLNFLERRQSMRYAPWDDSGGEEPQEADRNKDWLNVDAVANAVVEAFRRQVIRQANVGQQNSNSIYLGVTRRLITAWNQPAEPTRQEFSELVEELGRLEEKARPILKVGAIPSIPFDEFKGLLEYPCRTPIGRSRIAPNT